MWSNSGIICWWGSHWVLIYGQNITVWGPEEKERKKEEGEGEEKGRKGKKKGRKGEGGGASGTEVGYSNFIMKNVPKFK
jgi:hypothetical protein